ncbi:reverse transcriptase domain-containing protein [Tanacetum coccineum]|uniref:Reverse transcriptase domain-containing protein n=1 Tax=Tanacetum coccineum TaxID=301880 RepID=A0ABQ4YZM2_9ASTR
MASRMPKIIDSNPKFVNHEASHCFPKKVSTSSSTPAVSSDVAELKDMVRALILDKKNQTPAPAPVKAVEQSCVTCGGGHSYQNCPATDGNIYRDNIQEYVSQAAAVNYNQGNASYRPQMVANQIRPPGFPPMQNHQNNQNRGINFNQNRGNNFNQNRGNNFNQGQVYQPQINQPPTFQAPPYQAPVPPAAPGVSKPDFDNYVKANDAVMQNMQNQMANITDLITKFVNSNAVSTSGSGSLPSNIIANPKGDVKAITTRSGVSYNGPQISSPPMENEPEVTKEPCDFPEMNECLALADLGASINLMPLSIWKELSLPALTKTRMILELTDRTISNLTGIAEDVFVKVGTFFFPADFVVVDYVADPRVPLILGRPFLRTTHALIDVHGEQMTLRHDDQSVTFKVVVDYVADPRVPLDLRKTFLKGRTATFSYNIIESVNRVDVIDIACEEYVQEVLEIAKSGNPTSTLDLVIDSRSPSFTPFGGSDFLMEEIDEFLEHDDSMPPNYPPDLELKDLPSHLEYAFLEGDDKLPVIIAKNLKDEDKTALIKVLTASMILREILFKISDIKGIDPQFCTHKILMEENAQPVVQRRVNPKIHEVIKQEVIKLLDAGLIYPISDSPWVSPVHCVPKKGGITVVKNEENELIPTRLVTGWRVCIDYRKLNDATRKDHFPLPFMDQMLERLAGNEYYCFLDGFFGYFQIPIDPLDQEKTTFTCPYGTFAYRRMPFGLCNAPGTFQRCMVAIFHDMIEKTMEVFMDDFSVFGDSFSSCLSHLDKMLQRCEDTNLVLNWEKCHFMVKEGIVLGHKISKSGIEVDKSKVDVIAKLPHPTTVKGIRSFLGHAGFYQ